MQMQIQVEVSYAWWVNPLVAVLKVVGRVFPIPVDRVVCFIADRGVKMTCTPK